MEKFWPRVSAITQKSFIIAQMPNEISRAEYAPWPPSFHTVSIGLVKFIQRQWNARIKWLRGHKILTILLNSRLKENSRKFDTPHAPQESRPCEARGRKSRAVYFFVGQNVTKWHQTDLPMLNAPTCLLKCHMFYIAICLLPWNNAKSNIVNMNTTSGKLKPNTWACEICSCGE